MRDMQRIEMLNEERPIIERASAADLAFLAMDTGKVPQQFAVILILDCPGNFNLSQLRLLISDRILALPRMRQRLINLPPAFGRPIWVDWSCRTPAYSPSP
jgi:diacylglycerol O-acyltransferase / wax synthase